TLTMPQVEMGQGVWTSLAMIIAEELDATLAQLKLEQSPPDPHYANPFLGSQATGNSSSMRAFWTPLRKAGAGARALLVRAAAAQMAVPEASLRTEAGEVIHDASARRLTYGALVDAAAFMTAPPDPPLKDPRDFRLIGKPARRLDTPAKVDGSLRYGIDLKIPGALVATLAASPVFGGKVAHVDDSQAKGLPGVRQIVVLDDLVAVVADHMWAAKQGLQALDITWDEGPNANATSDQVRSELDAAALKPGAVARHDGDVAKALGAPGDDERIDASYDTPFLAHAPLEPMNYTVEVRPDGCEIWGGTQVIGLAQSAVATLLGVPPAKVIIHNQLMGGGFGRRLEVDGVVKAVRIAREVKAPVRVVWTREEDIQQELYRPAYTDRFSARVADGKVLAWSHKVVGSSVMARYIPPAFQNGLDPDAVDGARDMPYDVPDVKVEYVRQEPPGIKTAFWRSVGPSHNVFVVESFVDELAHKAGADPVTFRRGLLSKQPRLKAALDLAAEKSGWGKSLPRRCGRGVSIQTAFGSYLATIVEAEVDGDGEIRLRRITCGVDSGVIINPDTVEAQLQGGIIFGLTAALYGQITLDKGRVQQSNFHDYRMMRINETPPIEVHIIKSGEAPGGMGECGTSAAMPALTNALFAATGKRIRTLPVDRELLAERWLG
ncbi:MAG: molybdopterin cofactor-binding domain-containing protein, partial [Caulobacteraceae bacterium]